MAGWAHTLWQRKGLDPFQFVALDRRKQAWLIASELVEQKEPQAAPDRIEQSLRKSRSHKSKK